LVGLFLLHFSSFSGVIKSSMEGKSQKQTPLPLPENKEKLLQQLDSLNYAERINYAARLGRDHKVH
jgi:hypothetical protein